MKISKKNLLKLIKEELMSLLKERYYLDDPVTTAAMGNLERAARDKDEDEIEKATRLAKDVGAGQSAAAAAAVAALGAPAATKGVSLGITRAKQALAARAMEKMVQVVEPAVARVFVQQKGSNVARQAIHAAYRSVYRMLYGPNAITGAYKGGASVMTAQSRAAKDMANKFLKQVFDGKRSFNREHLERILVILQRRLNQLK